MRLAKRLENDPPVRRLAAQFVLLKIDTGNSDDWSAWSRKYEREGDGIPIVYVVRADGEQLYGKSGTPQPLEGFLTRALSNAGRILGGREMERLRKDARQAQQHIAEEQIDQAVALVARSAGSGSYAEAALAIDALAAELEEQGAKAFDEAAEKLGDGEATLEAALSLLEVERVYGRLPTLRKSFGSTMGEFRRDAETRDLLNQANFVGRAQAYEAEERWKQAVSSYQVVQSRFPDTPAAELAAAKLQELENKVDVPTTTVASDAPPKPGEQPAEATADERRAASQLRLGKVLLKNNSPKARGYLEKAIELAPDGPTADEARELLEEL